MYSAVGQKYSHAERTRRQEPDHGKACPDLEESAGKDVATRKHRDRNDDGDDQGKDAREPARPDKHPLEDCTIQGFIVFLPRRGRLESPHVDIVHPRNGFLVLPFDVGHKVLASRDLGLRTHVTIAVWCVASDCDSPC
jgi:hypothetical protein